MPAGCELLESVQRISLGENLPLWYTADDMPWTK